MKIHSQISTRSEDFKANNAFHVQAADELAAKLARGRQLSQEGAARRSDGKMSVRDRVHGLIDPDSTFMELSPLAGEGL